MIFVVPLLCIIVFSVIVVRLKLGLGFQSSAKMMLYKIVLILVAALCIFGLCFSLANYFIPPLLAALSTSNTGGGSSMGSSRVVHSGSDRILNLPPKSTPPATATRIPVVIKPPTSTKKPKPTSTSTSTPTPISTPTAITSTPTSEAGPVMQLSSTNVVFSSPSGGCGPDKRKHITIKNVGKGTLNWATGTPSDQWLVVPITSGSVPGGQFSDIYIEVHPEPNRSSGQLLATVTVTSQSNDESITINVTFNYFACGST